MPEMLFRGRLRGVGGSGEWGKRRVPARRREVPRIFFEAARRVKGSRTTPAASFKGGGALGTALRPAPLVVRPGRFWLVILWVAPRDG